MTPARRRARSLSNGVLLALGGAALAALLTAPPTSADEAISQEVAHRYVGVRKCRTCHKKKLLGNQVATWEQGLHQKALETLKQQRSIDLAKERGLKLPAHQAPECLRCHVTAYALPEAAFAYELDKADGVQCESCHGPGRDYRKKKVMSDPELAAEKGLWDVSRGTMVCVSCHNSESPTWDPKRFTLQDGTTVAFDFDQGIKRIEHPIPEDTKGRYLEIEAELKKKGLKAE